jgi:hypothetical protein
MIDGDGLGLGSLDMGAAEVEVSIELYVPFIAREIGTTPERVRPEYAHPKHMQALLWPVASYFHTVAGIAEYHEEAEAEADAVLEALEADPTAWINFTSEAARVLHDRATYAITVLEANAQAGEQVLRPPVSLEDDLQRVAAALLWLHRMELPSQFRGAQPR